ncbi:APC family permease [Mycolicibacterium aubagnense]|uniref:Amino acid permease n=1 Tax=Mycolicibacterium aubagnense TaxID=319707 RepID=A0ABM7I9I0_9MYCO|nr:APC family permease [Mycolicibacterium aubagnense]TLH60134.1 amino acid permease [Mycolicibacterium aubagnense]WGI34806.1 APC family permease [Mycolicibacterium aubagnense]BBX83297.1 amino acid permease [Mycolicibacterium aubagnense]
MAIAADLPPDSPATLRSAQSVSGVRAGALGFPTLLAQSVALISPTMTAVLIVPLAFSFAGNGTWLAYLFATIMLSFVVMNLNVFAGRSALPGSMYAYIGRGLGPRGGVLSGWTLLWSYGFIAIAGLAGFSIFVNQFLDAVGATFHVPAIAAFCISAALCWLVAYKDIRISSLLMLVLEGLSTALIIALCLTVLAKHGTMVDTQQLHLHGVGVSGITLAVVICIFSLVGFESATALGGEAKNPLHNVPRAVRWSLVIAGLFFVFVSYVEVIGASSHNLQLADLDAPLSTLSDAYQVGFLKAPICLGAILSFYSLTLSCVNAGSRILLPMAQHGMLSRHVGSIHSQNRTPHIAVSVYSLLVLGIICVMQIFTDPLTTFGDAGTLAAFGFLLAYFMVSVAAPVYLRKRGQLTGKNITISALALACLLVPTIGSFYPLPPVPVRYFPYYFLVYMLAGLAWLTVVSRRRPTILGEIEADLEASVDTWTTPPGTAGEARRESPESDSAGRQAWAT